MVWTSARNLFRCCEVAAVRNEVKTAPWRGLYRSYSFGKRMALGTGACVLGTAGLGAEKYVYSKYSTKASACKSGDACCDAFPQALVAGALLSFPEALPVMAISGLFAKARVFSEDYQDVVKKRRPCSP